MCTTCGCGNAQTRIEGKAMPDPLDAPSLKEAASHSPPLGARYRHAHAPD